MGQILCTFIWLDTASHFILITTSPLKRYHCSHFTDEKTKIQKVKVKKKKKESKSLGTSLSNQYVL